MSTTHGADAARVQGTTGSADPHDVVEGAVIGLRCLGDDPPRSATDDAARGARVGADLGRMAEDLPQPSGNGGGG